MKYNFISRTTGEIKSYNNLFHIKKGLSWEILNNYKPLFKPNEDDFNFLKRYGLYPSVFNIGVLQHLNMVYLFPNDLKRLKGGKNENGIKN